MPKKNLQAQELTDDEVFRALEAQGINTSDQNIRIRIASPIKNRHAQTVSRTVTVHYLATGNLKLFTISKPVTGSDKNGEVKEGQTTVQRIGSR